MRITIVVVVLLLAGLTARAQAWVQGTTTYISSQNVYVKFASTAAIATGDTLFSVSGDVATPCLIVKDKSSTSCVCTSLLATPVAKGTPFFARQAVPVATPPVATALPPGAPTVTDSLATPQAGVQVVVPDDGDLAQAPKEKINGRISVASYSNLYDGTSTHRMRYAFVFQGQHIRQSRWSVDNYITFRHTLGEGEVVRENIFDALKIYALSAQYDLNSHARVTVGRKINQRISNMGAVDGIQYEHNIGRLTVGAIGGFRPDFRDYSINPQLLQLGGYVSYNAAGTNGGQSTLAIVEQRNGGVTDRRFAYLQHSGALGKKVQVFGSMDVDLYENINEVQRSTLRLTNLFLSLRYSVSKKLRLNVSYDNRRNIVYFESYRNQIDQLIDDETRQGLRLGANYRLLKTVSWGMNTNWRFQKSDLNLSKNLNTYISFSRIPWVKASATISANVLQTNYLNSKMVGIRLNKELVKGVLNGELNARLLDYQYQNSEQHILQQMVGGSLSVNISRKLTFFAYYEGTFNATSTDLTRVNVRAVQRF